MSETLILDRRFSGPPGSANGGYTCGRLAALLDGPVEVKLRSPPPLDHPLEILRDAGGVRILDGAKVVAEARPAAVTIVPPPAPTWDEAVDAEKRYPWFETHPYPTCFVCSSKRAVGDGLRILPGSVAERTIAAATFVPDGSLADLDGRLRTEFVWASLDCPSFFGKNCFDPSDERVLLGTLAARIDERPRAGDRCICIGWFVGREGRKIHCGSALYSAAGSLLAVAQATWVALQSS